jgi:hypothetical protein
LKNHPITKILSFFRLSSVIFSQRDSLGTSSIFLLPSSSLISKPHFSAVINRGDDLNVASEIIVFKTGHSADKIPESLTIINPTVMNKPACALYSAILLMFLLSGCKPKENNAREEEAIKSVINAETQAWIDRDPQKMKEYYIHDRYQTRVNIQDSVYTITIGWDKRSTAIDTLAKYADWIGVDQFKVQKDFLALKIIDRTAWVILRETQDMIYNGSPAKARSIINIVLEKKHRDWKISCFVKSNV